MSDIVAYHTLANAFTVANIASSITVHVEAECKLSVVWEMLTEAGPDHFCLVHDNEHIVGYLTVNDNFVDYVNDSAGFWANPINPDQMIPASTPILELLPLFEQHYFFFVLSRNDIVQVVSFGDLDKLPMKLCLFSLFMELESEMLRAMTWPIGNPSEYVAYLRESRLSKAQELCRLKYKHETPERILLCTTFIDKKNIFLSDPTLSSCLPLEGKTEIDRFFNTVEKVRNQVAHSDSIVEIMRGPTELNAFTSTLNNVIRSISNTNLERMP